MKIKQSVLSLSILILFLILGTFTIINYSELSEGEGWGMVGVIGIAGILATGFFIDLIITNLVKKNKTLKLVLTILAIILYVAIFISFLNS